MHTEAQETTGLWMMMIIDDLHIVLVWANSLYGILGDFFPPHGSVCSFLKTGLRISELLDEKYLNIAKTNFGWLLE